MKYATPWLLDQIANGQQPDYLYFWGHTAKGDTVGKECLSQWYPAGFEFEGNHFATAEHWMMYHKALVAGDAESAAAVLAEPSARAVKAVGRRVKNYDDKLWATRKYPLVIEGNVLKFSANPVLREFLLGTGDTILVEASPFDKQWGIGLNPEDAKALADPAQWQGTNLLGWALMEARDRLKALSDK